MGLIFEPTRTPPQGWTVRDEAGEVVGSVEWHDWLGVYGIASGPGLPFVFDPSALEEISRFVDGANAG